MTMVSSAWEQALRVKAQSAKVLSYTWRKGGRVAWVVLATSIVMLLPLLMEIEREGSVIELEKLQIKDLKAQGFSDQQIQQMGLTPAVEPSVGLNAPSPPMPLPK
mmetsp:Transcript_11197/g.36992  ORF Transcript_11197/g.36992 Transcript_11197/m.36992 type:complete len:105 (+) Transcript_11197:49-363(+)|eukprot:CAMPEP_0118919834 /NCGR_PEP_ID=MMETSP1166-20130328/18764_1 /TAXON_ID=1104430 /ORGANISM="Chrysoreinhardia sp, Strain CCMP3193" /LENGTH=104 /DNA_ID=CAMNT_0006860369 /DNA_START=29 /DNA_END=343 /DNA_ORIENTATION=+